jgi:hypothetical protein
MVIGGPGRPIVQAIKPLENILLANKLNYIYKNKCLRSDVTVGFWKAEKQVACAVSYELQLQVEKYTYQCQEISSLLDHEAYAQRRSLGTSPNPPGHE